MARNTPGRLTKTSPTRNNDSETLYLLSECVAKNNKGKLEMCELPGPNKGMQTPCPYFRTQWTEQVVRIYGMVLALQTTNQSLSILFGECSPLTATLI